MKPGPHLQILAAGLLWGCGSEPSGPPPDVVLEIDGLQITATELAAFEDYFQGLDPTMGRAYRTRVLLDRFVLPLHLARRAFGEKRERQRQKAAALVAAVGSGSELERLGERHGGHEPDRPFGRNGLPLPVARYAFDDRHLFRVSPPIEVPQGFCVIDPRRIVRGPSTVDDQVAAYIVLFYTHTGPEFRQWYEQQQEGLRGRVSYVHPDLREALPSWLKKP